MRAGVEGVRSEAGGEGVGEGGRWGGGEWEVKGVRVREGWWWRGVGLMGGGGSGSGGVGSVAIRLGCKRVQVVGMVMLVGMI